jgi:hypothetical protein
LEITWNSSAEENVFIVPRNKNIKKIYVWLAFNVGLNDNERLIHEPLHRRLSYKILSTVEEAFYEAQNSLLNSPLGKYVFDSKDSYLALIAKYVQETEAYLFDPKKQDLVTGEDRITLPDFRPVATKEDVKNKTLDNYLPRPAAMANANLTYDDFTVYYVDPSYNEERIVKDGITIVKRENKQYVISKTITFYNPENLNDTRERLYLIYYNDKFNASISEVDRNSIIDFVLGKNVVDTYTEEGHSLETIATMFPELNNNGVLYQFIDYVKKLKELDFEDSRSEETGLNRSLSDINFYNQLLNEKGETIKIEATGVNTYNIFGEKVSTFTDLPGTPVGIALIDGDTYALSLNQRNGELDVYYSDSTIISWIKMDVNGNDAIILPGIGITSIYQINLFESFYYGNILFIINDEKILWSLDRINFTELPITFNYNDEVIKGISFLPDGNLYLLTDRYFYMIEKFDINDTPYNLVVLSGSIDKFKVIEGMVGTVINAVSIPLETIDDFDINDKKIVNKLIQYYNTTKLMYYWYSTESNISIELFNDNISRLNAKLETTVDAASRARLEKRIARQEYFKNKIA